MKKRKIYEFYLHYRLFIFPAVVALSSLILILFAIYPQTIKLLENQKVANSLMNKSKFLATKVAALENYDENELSRKVNIALSVFPIDKDYGNILGLLQGVIVESGFTVSSILLGNTSGKVKNASTFEVKLEIEGPRRLFQDLLVKAENSPRIMRVKSIDISAMRGSETVDAAIILDVLYAPLSQTSGLEDSPLPVLSQKEEELLNILSRTALTAGPSTLQNVQRGKINPFE